jgi:hypothetical protein
MISSDTKVQIDILMKKYALLREEVMFYSRTAKLHTKYFQIFFAAGLAISWYLFFLAKPDKVEDIDKLADILKAIGMTDRELIISFVFALDITAYYFAFDILDCYYCIFLAGARLADIEDQINSRIGSKILIWDSQFQKLDSVIHAPSRMTITLYQMALVVAVSCIIPLVVYWKVLRKSFDTGECVILPIMAAAVCLFLSARFAYVCYILFKKERAEGPLEAIRKIHRDNEIAAKSPAAKS